jgi:hypothetical protein
VTFDSLYNVFAVLYCLSFPLWIPAAIGLYLLTSRRNEFSYMAGVLTLKPIITTPIWAVIVGSLQDSGVDGARIALYSILPGASLTILALVIFRHLFFRLMSISAMLLIVLDCMRWINSGLLTAIAFLPYNRANDTLTGIFAIIGLIFPTAYSVVALTIVLARRKN